MFYFFLYSFIHNHAPLFCFLCAYVVASDLLCLGFFIADYYYYYYITLVRLVFVFFPPFFPSPSLISFWIISRTSEKKKNKSTKILRAYLSSFCFTLFRFRYFYIYRMRCTTDVKKNDNDNKCVDKKVLNTFSLLLHLLYLYNPHILCLAYCFGAIRMKHTDVFLSFFFSLIFLRWIYYSLCAHMMWMASRKFMLLLK